MGKNPEDLWEDEDYTDEEKETIWEDLEDRWDNPMKDEDERLVPNNDYDWGY